MATPYFQFSYDMVPSTQDVARDKLNDLPVLVIAHAQSEGRGRTGNTWLTADAAVAVSYAYRGSDRDGRPVSLIAGIAVLRATEGLGLKWPNDLMSGDLKVGGILVERSDDVTVVGLGLNLWWSNSPEGMGAIYSEQPSANKGTEVAALWGAEFARLVDGPGWPIDEYRRASQTIGHQITWEPAGSGKAVDIADDGGLVVETSGGRTVLHSGAVSHVRRVG